MLRITIDHDQEVGVPWEDCDGCWRVISTSPRHNHYESPETYQHIGFRRKLAVGLAFQLSRYSHGSTCWSLVGDGPQCSWDTTQNGGYLVWDHKPREMGAKTYEDRRKDAKAFLVMFNDWCNGNCYWYKVERVTECSHCGAEVAEDLGSCGGFIGDDSLFDALREVMGSYPGEGYEFAGAGAWLGTCHFNELPLPAHHSRSGCIVGFPPVPPPQH
jgi:hypothetical protein